MPEIKIKCPHCGYEYLPCEVFYPDFFLGNSKKIIRDDMGKIIYTEGDDMQLTEEYNCDNCHKDFKVIASVSFKSESTKLETIDFDDDLEIPE